MKKPTAPATHESCVDIPEEWCQMMFYKNHAKYAKPGFTPGEKDAQNAYAATVEDYYNKTEQLRKIQENDNQVRVGFLASLTSFSPNTTKPSSAQRWRKS